MTTWHKNSLVMTMVLTMVIATTTAQPAQVVHLTTPVTTPTIAVIITTPPTPVSTAFPTPSTNPRGPPGSTAPIESTAQERTPPPPTGPPKPPAATPHPTTPPLRQPQTIQPNNTKAIPPGTSAATPVLTTVQAPSPPSTQGNLPLSNVPRSSLYDSSSSMPTANSNSTSSSHTPLWLCVFGGTGIVVSVVVVFFVVSHSSSNKRDTEASNGVGFALESQPPPLRKGSFLDLVLPSNSILMRSLSLTQFERGSEEELEANSMFALPSNV